MVKYAIKPEHLQSSQVTNDGGRIIYHGSDKNTSYARLKMHY